MTLLVISKIFLLSSDFKMHHNHNWLSRPQPNISRSFAMLAFSNIFISISIILREEAKEFVLKI